MHFIEQVLAQKKTDIARKKRLVPRSELERRARACAPRDFARALRGGERIIAEVKMRSPRVPHFLQSGAVDALPAVYEANGAAALSVVTDHANFGTSLADAKRFRERVAMPVLVKDFFYDPYQIAEARAHGADAVLLICRILSDARLRDLLEYATSLGMDVLAETHTRPEIDRALAAGARIIGINNRDLDSLRVTLDVTRQLAYAIPDNIVTVSESGIRQRGDIQELSRLGVDAFLVGGALLDSRDPGALLRSLGRVPPDASETIERTKRNA